MTRILIVDDEESICWGLSQLCTQMSIESETASSAEKGIDLARQSKFDLIIMDVRLPGMDGISAISKFHETLGSVPVITMTAFGDLQTAIEAIQKGAFEYIVKPFNLETVRSKIQQAITTRSLADSISQPHEQSDASSPAAGRFVGSSSLMQEVYKQIALTTTTNSPVLVTGESGTGKELAARSIHDFSDRSSSPFVAVNVAALNPSLAESELFGHVKGAFTGADSDRTGLIQQANGGTLFLDEVAEIPLGIQVKLLRVLDMGEVTPVGSNAPVKTDFRLISATHQDLLSQINHGEFRHDLFYRIRTLEIKLPPLRDRKEDIPELVAHFLRGPNAPAGISASAQFIEVLSRRHWRGNVRELQSVVERAATLARGGILLPEHEATEPATAKENRLDLDGQIRQLAEKWIEENWHTKAESLYEKFLAVVDPGILTTAFELSEEQYSAAARKLGIHRTTLRKKLDEIENK